MHIHITRCNRIIGCIIFFPPTYSRMNCNLIFWTEWKLTYTKNIRTNIFQIWKHLYKIGPTLWWKPICKLNPSNNSCHECILFHLKCIFHVKDNLKFLQQRNINEIKWILIFWRFLFYPEVKYELYLAILPFSWTLKKKCLIWLNILFLFSFAIRLYSALSIFHNNWFQFIFFPLDLFIYFFFRSWFDTKAYRWWEL